MKLIMTIIDRRNAKHVTRELLKGGFQVTKIDSRGGFLNYKSTTLLSSVRDERVQEAIEIVRRYSNKRDVLSGADIPLSGMPRRTPAGVSPAGIRLNADYLPDEVNRGGATVFVLNVEHLEKI